LPSTQHFWFIKQDAIWNVLQSSDIESELKPWRLIFYKGKDLSNTDLHSATDFWTCYDSETTQPIPYMRVLSHRQDAYVKANWIDTKRLNLGIQDVWYTWERHQVSSPSCKMKRQLPTQAGLLYTVKIQ
jgi:hypothetical protein